MDPRDLSSLLHRIAQAPTLYQPHADERRAIAYLMRFHLIRHARQFETAGYHITLAGCRLLATRPFRPSP